TVDLAVARSYDVRSVLRHRRPAERPESVGGTQCARRAESVGCAERPEGAGRPGRQPGPASGLVAPGPGAAEASTPGRPQPGVRKGRRHSAPSTPPEARAGRRVPGPPDRRLGG